MTGRPSSEAVRVEHIGNATLYRGDCTSILPTLPSVDAVLTDPPYELSSAGPGASHVGMSLNKFDSANYKAIVDGFDHETIFALIEGVCKPFNMFCFCSNKQISRFMAYHEARGRSTSLLVWHKTNAAPFANGVWRGDIEYCVHSKDSGAVFIGNAEEKKKVSEFPAVVDSAHPTVKPLQLIQKYVGICSTRGQTILDPFMGSGTTGVACAKLGRKFIGIEIDPVHFETACRRIETAHRQPDLFLEKPKPATQEALL
jgi:site-specific DNA-methyltransferase (adenine-specific)